MLTGQPAVLLVENMQQAADYYRDRLGFELVLYEENSYGTAERDDCHVPFAHAGGGSRQGRCSPWRRRDSE